MRLLAAATLAVLACVAAGCGDTLQDQPIPHNELEGLIVSPTPVYWLGRSFEGLQVVNSSQDPGGAYTLQYGDCLEGGQSVCVPPLRVVTSADNSFLPGTPAAGSSTRVRGAEALLARGGRTIAIATGPVVVEIIARDARLAAAAARTIVPINVASSPGQPLPPRLPDNGYAEKALPSQAPSAVRVLGPASSAQG